MSDPREARTASPAGSPFAVAVMFFANGLAMASSFSRIPGIRDQVGATPTQLAFALVCVGIGSILGMPFTGQLVDRYSSQTVSRVATALLLGGWAIVPLAGSVPVLALILLITGLGTGVGDVAMNVQGHLVEQRHRQVPMPYWHGLFSFGAVAGALAGALAASLGLPLAWQLAGVSAVLTVAMWSATARYLPDAGLHPDAQQTPDEPIFDEPQVLATERGLVAALRRSPISRVEILLGIIVFATAVGEGAANDWLALMLVDNRDAPPALGALTYAGFNLTMAIGRFAGGAIIQRFGRVPVLAGGRWDRQPRSGGPVPATLYPDCADRRGRLGSRAFCGLPVGDVRGGRSAGARRSSHRGGVDHRLRRLPARCSVDRVPRSHDAPGPGAAGGGRAGAACSDPRFGRP
jgi:MFS family permease